ncbi:unnamed protein product [Cyclocybe aegerita]|uniref:F-box domain-containing protein n=1 Tax=Cyclocybe aegerita TaxID=1973307 RepID=A0A8S0X116_CYCAE|nr:unnamed protein product [Cyclocybe aegerita]
MYMRLSPALECFSVFSFPLLTLIRMAASRVWSKLSLSSIILPSNPAVHSFLYPLGRPLFFLEAVVLFDRLAACVDSKMTPILELPSEILNEIFNHFLPILTDGDYKRHAESVIEEPADKSSLLSAALTCKAFLEPALDRLWWDMDDLTPLFDLIPGFQPSTDASTLGKIHGPIAHEVVQRLEVFCKRIQIYHECGKESIDISAYERVLQEYNQETLLPSLRILSITNSIPQLPLLLAHPAELRTLRILQNKTPNSDDYVHTSMKQLPQQVKTITHLRLETFLTKELLVSVLRLQGLQWLHLRHTNDDTPFQTDVDTLLDICSMLHLRRLYFDGDIHLASGESSSRPKTICPTLNDLHFSPRPRIPFKRLLHFLSSASFPQLNYLSINTECEPDDVPHWNYLFRTLVENTSPEFEFLDIHDMSSITWQNHNLTLRNVPDLFKLKLVGFESPRSVFSIKDADISALASAWPNMRSLSLSTCPPTSFTFQTIIELAEAFPNLGLLALGEVNLNILPPLNSVPILKDHDLIQLLIDPGEWEIKDLKALAGSLDRLLPYLHNFGFMGPRDLDDPEQEVVSSLREMQKARRDELSR